MSPLSSSQGIIRFGDFDVDPHSGELRKHGLRIKLQVQPFQVRQILLEHPGEVITREELQKRIWPADTFVDFDQGLNNAVKKLRDALADDAEKPRFIETLPRRGYRFLAPITGNHQGESPTRAPKWKIAALVVAAVAAATVAGVPRWRLSRLRMLTEKDTIVLGDFANSTGDPVFGGTLREGLSVQLEQSPFLSLVSENRVQHTLRLMDQPPDTKLTPGIARALCERTGSSAVLDGSISQIGMQYLLTLRATNCSNGESLASTEAQANDKDHVLEALSRIASEMRTKLGESLNTVQKFDTPLAEATTPFLEALQAFSLGLKVQEGLGDDARAIPLYQKAIHHDPNFAAAYAWLASAYGNLGEAAQAAQNTLKAYELRERVSEIERLNIESGYHLYVSGDFQKLRQASELWAQIYPRDWNPQNILGMIFDALGQNDKALAAYREALRLDPASSVNFTNLVLSCLFSNRLEEAKAWAEEAEAKKLDSPELRTALYKLAFLQNDEAGMAEAVAWSAGKLGVEDVLLFDEAATNGYFGRLRKSREFSDRAVASAERAEETETAAGYEAQAALQEALLGNAAKAQQLANSAIGLTKGLSPQYATALALAFAGDATRAQSLADDLDRRLPDNTLVQFNYLPSVRGQLALIRNDASKAIEALQVAAPYELGSYGTGAWAIALYPVYVRGETYLAAHQGREAAAEFQRILDHRGVVQNEPIGALAHLGLARAYLMSGDVAKARTAYQDFLKLWKDADPDIPVLQQAKAENAKFQ